MSKVQLTKINLDLTNKNLNSFTTKVAKQIGNNTTCKIKIPIYLAIFVVKEFRFLLVRSRLILVSWTLLLVLLAFVSKIIESLCGCLTATAGFIFYLRSDLSFFATIRTLSLRSREFQFLIQYHSKRVSINGAHFPRPVESYNNYHTNQPMSRLLYKE